MSINTSNLSMAIFYVFAYLYVLTIAKDQLPATISNQVVSFDAFFWVWTLLMAGAFGALTAKWCSEKTVTFKVEEGPKDE